MGINQFLFTKCCVCGGTWLHPSNLPCCWDCYLSGKYFDWIMSAKLPERESDVNLNTIDHGSEDN